MTDKKKTNTDTKRKDRKYLFIWNCSLLCTSTTTEGSTQATVTMGLGEEGSGDFLLENNPHKNISIISIIIELSLLRLRGGDEPDEFEMFQNGPFGGLGGYPR